jgi:hypothetical protein
MRIYPKYSPQKPKCYTVAKYGLAQTEALVK